MREPPTTREEPAGLAAAAEVIAAGASGRWLRALSQFGLCARGVVYLLVGYLTFRLAFAVHGRIDEPASGTGAVQEAARHSWGLLALLLLAAGFAGYALTQLVEAVFRPQHARGALNRWRQRVVSTWGCVLYSAFCVSTISVLAASRRTAATAKSEQRQDIAISGSLLGNQAGRALLMLTGVVIVLAGAELGRRAVRLTFQERFSIQLHPRLLATGVRVLGAYGCIARAAVFVLVGVFLLEAAILGEAQQTKGLDAAFRSVARSTYGPVTLSALALGLFCYGMYCLFEARYRDFTPGR
jgi:hypothetical protein